MNRAKIQARGIRQEGASTRWSATGYVDGVGWLEAWGTTLVQALEAWQAKVDRFVAHRGEEDRHA